MRCCNEREIAVLHCHDLREFYRARTYNCRVKSHTGHSEDCYAILFSFEISGVSSLSGHT